MIPTWNYTTISTELSEMILKRKNDYYRHLSDKLNHPETSAKAYWPILKTLYIRKKIPLIPPILANNKFTSNLKEKANQCSTFFASQFTSVSNNSVYPRQNILFLMLVYQPFSSKTRIFLRLYVPLTIIKPIFMMIYL